MERLIEIGKIEAKAASDIRESKLGIGFEKLDRDVFNPEKAYDKVAAIGVKWVRLQSGWARTEKTKGVYDFSWLDSIVDNMISRGLKPWLCLCYGNGLYTESAKAYFGAVGCPPIFTEEEKTAWANYVKATVTHFQDRITWYEVWNEPDGKWCWKHGVSAEEYGQFVVDTADAIRQVFPKAKVIGGVICVREIGFLNTALKTGMAEAIDAVSFHEYTATEHKVFERVAVLRALCRHYNPKIEIIQGESGSQSRSDGAGALKGGAWTPLRQAKQLARHTIADLISDVTFTSYFTTVDMIEALNGLVGQKASYLDYGYFGVLGADFDENGFSTGEYTPKPSYYALQTICSIFAEEVAPVELPVIRLPRESQRIFGRDCDDFSIISGGFRKPNGACAFAYWNSTNLMTTGFESTITLQAATLSDDIRLVDLLNGTIYRLPDSILEKQKDGCVLLKNLPLTDYPLLLTFGDFL
jgi:hypothetical protein